MTIVKKYTYKQRGFTMIELLLALLCLSVCIPLFARIIFVLVKAVPKDYQAEDRVGVAQLQVIVAQSDSFELINGEAHMNYHDQTIRLVQYEDKLVKRSGFEVMLQNVDQVSFQIQNNCLNLQWQRGDHHEEAVLGCE